MAPPPPPFGCEIAKGVVPKHPIWSIFQFWVDYSISQSRLASPDFVTNQRGEAMLQIGRFSIESECVIAWIWVLTAW